MTYRQQGYQPRIPCSLPQGIQERAAVGRGERHDLRADLESAHGPQGQREARIAKRFEVGNPKELSSFIRVLALYRNVCAHGERLFSHRCHVEIPDTALHAKLGIEKIGPDYACGKVDVFSAVIALRYLLRDDEFKAFKAKLVKCVNGYLLLDESIGEERLLEAMGFPAEWKKITRYKIWDRPA